MADSFLTDAAWLFFAAWTVLVSALGIAAFGRDLLPSKAHSVPPRKTSDSVLPSRTGVR
jgi:hypothetical protein